MFGWRATFCASASRVWGREVRAAADHRDGCCGCFGSCPGARGHVDSRAGRALQPAVHRSSRRHLHRRLPRGQLQLEVEDGITEGFSMELRRFNVLPLLAGQPTRPLHLRAGIRARHRGDRARDRPGRLAAEPAFTVRAGILLPPVGYFNQNHDSPRWDFIDRPLVSTEIVPATLSEIGVGVLWKALPAGWTLTYDLYLTNGVQTAWSKRKGITK